MLQKTLTIIALAAFAFLFGEDPLKRSFDLETLPDPTASRKGPRLSSTGLAHLQALLAAPNNAEAQRLYAGLDGCLAWFGETIPTAQARQIIESLKHADQKGLRPGDYDGPLWDARLQAFLGSLSVSEVFKIEFDVALTAATLRFLSDLHIGRVNPQSLHFEFATGGKPLDLSEFLRSQILEANDVQSVVESVEPQFLAYRRTLEALHTYLELSRQDDGKLLAVPSTTVRPGDYYSGAPQLATLLERLRDLELPATGSLAVYSPELVAAVKHFQIRHGFEANGILDRRTLAQLNTPLSRRVLQLQLTLERWRWLPQTFDRPPVVVNIPEFRLYAINKDHHVALEMNVVVGRAYRHNTPVFTGEIHSVVFRPYWNVPAAIQRTELLPEIEKQANYLAENSYEIVDAHDQVVEDTQDEKERTEKLRSGAWRLRQKPGTGNSLGLVKFDILNPYDIYLHGTPAQQLFAQSRRDFSHGCIRVEDPTALAVWVLHGNPGWTEERIRAAMNGDQTLRVNLQQPIPAWILYGTAVVRENGEVHFLNDIYGHDAALERALRIRTSRTVE